jgi:hypothetical protein
MYTQFPVYQTGVFACLLEMFFHFYSFFPETFFFQISLSFNFIFICRAINRKIHPSKKREMINQLATIVWVQRKWRRRLWLATDNDWQCRGQVAGRRQGGSWTGWSTAAAAVLTPFVTNIFFLPDL